MEISSSLKNINQHLSKIADGLSKQSANTGIDFSSYEEDDISEKIDELTKKLMEKLEEKFSLLKQNEVILTKIYKGYTVPCLAVSFLNINEWPEIIVYVVVKKYPGDHDSFILGGSYDVVSSKTFGNHYEIILHMSPSLTKNDFFDNKNQFYNEIKSALHHEIGHAFKNFLYKKEEGLNSTKGNNVYDDTGKIKDYQKYKSHPDEIDSSLLSIKEELKTVIEKMADDIVYSLGEGETFGKLFPKILNTSPTWRSLVEYIPEKTKNKLKSKLSKFVMELLSIDLEDLQVLQS